MTADSGRWGSAIAEHERVVADFVASIRRFDAGAWHRPPAPGRWSAAEVALHVCESYEFGIAAARGGPGMRLRTTPIVAWFARTILLPRLLARERFPRGASAPSEVRPDPQVALRLTPAEATSRLQDVAASAASALRTAADQGSGIRVTHAYFGPLTPLMALRLLSAHTRHHTRGLEERRSA